MKTAVSVHGTPHCARRIALWCAITATAAALLAFTGGPVLADAYAPQLPPLRTPQRLIQRQPRASCSRHRHHRGSSSRSSTSRLAAVGQRRAVFGWLKRAAVLTGFGYSCTALSTPPAVAADGSVPDGRVVSLVVANLGGVEGQTGTVKIQLAPAWAPKGVARFEVRRAIDRSIDRSGAGW